MQPSGLYIAALEHHGFMCINAWLKLLLCTLGIRINNKIEDNKSDTFQTPNLFHISNSHKLNYAFVTF